MYSKVLPLSSHILIRLLLPTVFIKEEIEACKITIKLVSLSVCPHVYANIFSTNSVDFYEIQ
jgi:hypothetical protein